MTLTAGEVLTNRYRIIKLLGEGGFGAVYRAWDLSLKRPVAVKENLEVSPEAQRQFEREATTLAQLTHPNLPRVTDHFFLPGQGQYLVMDFIDGMDLGTMVKSLGAIDSNQAIHWISQIASALEYLHKQPSPIIHRDIKPANIRIRPDGSAVLVDFGLVKVFNPQLRTTMGARAITPGYSPPEQYGTGMTDARSDIYALGATLYACLTGVEPLESVQRMAGVTLPSAHQVNTQLLESTGRVIDRAMALNPLQRYQTVEEFKTALLATTSRPIQPTQAFTVSAPATSTGALYITPPPAPARSSLSWLLWLTIPFALLGVLAILFGVGWVATTSMRPTPTPVEVIVRVPVTATPDRDATAIAEATATAQEYIWQNAQAQLTADADTISALQAQNAALQVTLQAQANASITTPTSDPCAGAPTISIGSVISNSFPAGSLHCFVFTASSGQAVTFMVSADFDSLFELYDANYNQVARDDDSGGNLNPLLVFTPTYSGVYYLLLVPYNSAYGGSYTLTVSQGMIGVDFSGATPLPTNTQIRGAITNATFVTLVNLNYTTHGVLYYFEANAGQNIQINVRASSIGSQLDPYVELYSPSYLYLAGDDDTGGNYESELRFTLPETGRYYILVRSVGNTFGTDATFFYEVLLGVYNP